jgi:hypothetical protein
MQLSPARFAARTRIMIRPSAVGLLKSIFGRCCLETSAPCGFPAQEIDNFKGQDTQSTIQVTASLMQKNSTAFAVPV